MSHHVVFHALGLAKGRLITLWLVVVDMGISQKPRLALLGFSKRTLLKKKQVPSTEPKCFSPASMASLLNLPSVMRLTLLEVSC